MSNSAPDGRRLAMAWHGGSAGVWDVQTGYCLWDTFNETGIETMTFTRKGKSVIMPTHRGERTEVCNTSSGELQFAIPARYLQERLMTWPNTRHIRFSDFERALLSPDPITRKGQWFSIATLGSDQWVCRNGKALLRLPSGLRVQQWEARGCRVWILCLNKCMIVLTFEERDRAYPKRIRGRYVYQANKGSQEVRLREDEEVRNTDHENEIPREPEFY